MSSPTRHEISPEALDRIRDAAEAKLREYFDGQLRSMRVVFTTHEIARSVIRGGPGAPSLDPPDDRPVYVVVVEGDLRQRKGPPRTGSWVSIYVNPSFVARGFSGPVAPGSPAGDRIINLDLNELGRVYEITDL